MENPIKAATSAFDLSFFVKIFVAVFLVNLVAGVITRFWPGFNRIYNVPASYLFTAGE